jgi:hypothetical protein
MLILFLGYRQVTINTNKQEQATPIRRELSKLLALVFEYLPVFRKREQELKAQVSKK